MQNPEAFRLTFASRVKPLCAIRTSKIFSPRIC